MASCSSESGGVRRTTTPSPSTVLPELDTPDFALAADRSFLKRCVRRRQDKEGDWLDPFGRPFRVERIHYWSFLRIGGDRYADFGCAVTVTLLMRILTEGVWVFLILFAISWPQSSQNYERNQDRNWCREYLSHSYDFLVYGQGQPGDGRGGSGALGVWPRPQNGSDGRPPSVVNATDADAEGCGFRGLPMRQYIELIEEYLMYALGSCEEYSNATHLTIPSPTYSGVDPFINVPRSVICVDRDEKQKGGGGGQAAADWAAQVVCPLLVLVFLLRIRWLQRAKAMSVDKALFTASDYSVHVAGIERDADCEVVRQTIFADLQRSGFQRDRIVEVVVAPQCCAQANELRRLYWLWEQQKGLEVPLVLAGAGQRDQQHTPDVQRELEVMEAKVTACEGKVRRLAGLAPLAAGHAFITFRFEADRDRLLHDRGGGWLHVLRHYAPLVLVRHASGSFRRRGSLSASRMLGDARIREAPEPSEVVWRYVGICKREKRKRLARTYGFFGLLIAFNAAFVVGVKTLQNHETVTAWGTTEQTFLALVFAASTSLTNLAMRLINRMLTAHEGHHTYTSQEISTYHKLSVAYVLNTVLVPLFVFSFPFFVSQAWYEPGGAVSSAVALLFADMLSSILRGAMADVVARRYLLSRLLLYRNKLTQARLDQLWEPVSLPTGELYAAMLRTMALTLVYAPFYPPAYLIGAAALTVNFLANRFAICFWYRSPPHIDDSITSHFRHSLLIILLLNFSSNLIAQSLAQPDLKAFTQLYIRLGCVLGPWFIFVAFPFHRVNCLAKYNGHLDTTEGIAYEDVFRLKGVELASYACPCPPPAPTFAQIEAAAMHFAGPQGACRRSEARGWTRRQARPDPEAPAHDMHQHQTSERAHAGSPRLSGEDTIDASVDVVELEVELHPPQIEREKP